MITEMLIKDDFKQWLQDKDEYAPIGDVNSGTNCPMAQFLRMRITQEEMDDKIIELSLGIHFLDYCDLDEDAAFSEPMPEWAIKFYDQLLHNLYYVTAHDCLMALEKIE